MKLAPIVAAALLLASTAANAAPAATVTSPGLGYTTAPYTLGFIFTLGSNTTATKLGIYDWNADGLETNAQVGLWKADGTLLAQATVPGGTLGELIGTFRYVDISKVALSAGASYLVGSYMNSTVVGTATSFGTNQGGSGGFNPLITFAQDRYSPDDYAFSFPGSTNGFTGGMWAGGNVVFGVPEPASWAMLIVGFGLVGAVARRRAGQMAVSN